MALELLRGPYLRGIKPDSRNRLVYNRPGAPMWFMCTKHETYSYVPNVYDWHPYVETQWPDSYRRQWAQ